MGYAGASHERTGPCKFELLTSGRWKHICNILCLFDCVFVLMVFMSETCLKESTRMIFVYMN